MSDERLINYIKNNLSEGHSIDDIKSKLLDAGWKKDLVDQAVDEVNSQLPPKNNSFRSTPDMSSMSSRDFNSQHLDMDSSSSKPKYEISENGFTENDQEKPKRSIGKIMTLILLILILLAGVGYGVYYVLEQQGIISSFMQEQDYDNNQNTNQNLDQPNQDDVNSDTFEGSRGVEIIDSNNENNNVNSNFNDDQDSEVSNAPNSNVNSQDDKSEQDIQPSQPDEDFDESLFVEE